MDVPKEVVKRQTVADFVRPMIYDLAFGLFSYVILFFILVGLILPALTSSYIPQAGIEETASPRLAFWIATAAGLFVVQVFFADFTLRPLKSQGLRFGILAGAIMALLLVAVSPIIYSDDFSRSSLLNIGLLLLSPFLGQVAGGWFVSRRAKV